MKSYTLEKFFKAFAKRKWEYPSRPVLKGSKQYAFKWSEIFRKLAKLQLRTLTLRSFIDREIDIMKPNKKFKKHNFRFWLNSLFILLLVILLYSCSSDNVTGPVTPPVNGDTILYQADSMRCDFHDSIPATFWPKIFGKYVTDTTIKKIRFTASGQTNNNGSYIIFGFMLDTGNTGWGTNSIVYTSVNGNFDVTFYNTYTPRTNFYAAMGEYINNPLHDSYIKLSNIKIYQYH
jgi:hypothetical protein